MNLEAYLYGNLNPDEDIDPDTGKLSDSHVIYRGDSFQDARAKIAAHLGSDASILRDREGPLTSEEMDERRWLGDELAGDIEAYHGDSPTWGGYDDGGAAIRKAMATP